MKDCKTQTERDVLAIVAQMTDAQVEQTNLSREDVVSVLSQWVEMLQNGFTLEHLEAKFVLGKGVGVFAKRKILANERIEYCHCIGLETPRQYLGEPQIQRYAYGSNNKALIALGFGSLYNSTPTAEEANAWYSVHTEANFIVVFAKRDIEAGEEIVCHHGAKFYYAWCRREAEK